MSGPPGPPRLSVHTQPTPPPPSQGPRRPQGARRRGVTPGLYIANPDNSDEDAPWPSSPVRGSPVSTSSGTRWASTSTSTSTPSVPISTPSSISAAGSPRSALPPIPSIPAPQSSPLPYTPLPSASVPPPVLSTPPLPPPQPERHARRAQTTPMPDNPRPAHEQRPSLGSNPFLPHPASPSRALPPLPSPPPASAPLGALPPTPSSSHSTEFGALNPMASPDSGGGVGVSPVTTIGSARSHGSGDMGRTRSGSVQSSKVRVQVTTDNESFTTVDITGMQTPEGIKERVFSKLRFRDDEYNNLSLFRTDVDEQPDSTPVSHEQLLPLCQKMGDAKATLKFFVMHTVPTSAGATIVPPVPMAEVPRIVTDALTPGHSKDSSLSSASELYAAGTSMSDWSEIAPEEADGHGSLVRTATTRSARLKNRATGSPSGSAAPSPIQTRQSTLPSQSNALASTSSTPVNAVSGPSTRAGPSDGDLALALGALPPDADMDEGTRALIAEWQRNDAVEEQERKRQLLEDEAFARRQQQQERDEWERSQMVEAQNAQNRQQQIESDEQEARRFQNQLQRIEDEEADRMAARAAWDEEQREREADQDRDRPTTFADERRQRAQHWRNQAQGGGSATSSFDSHTLAALGPDRPYAPRRPSESQYAYDGYTGTYDGTGRRPSNNDLQRMRPTHPGQRNNRLAAEQPIQNTRSMDNLRPYNGDPSRTPFPAASARTSHTPTPTSGAMYRQSTSQEQLSMSQDGRYPGPQIATPDGVGFLAFPSPQPHSAESSWTGSANSRRAASHDRLPSSPRPRSYDQAPPQTATLPRRPLTLHDESPPNTWTDWQYDSSWKPRRGSVDVRTRPPPFSETTRRTSESSVGAGEQTMLPYASPGPEDWLLPPRSRRETDPDAQSIAGTISSQATTIRPGMSDEDDSADTARAGDWTTQLRHMIENGSGGGTLRPPAHAIMSQPAHAIMDDDEDEATLFITGPARTAEPQQQLGQSAAVRASMSRPNLFVNTSPRSGPSRTRPDSATDSATDTESESGRMRRAKSFRPPKDQPGHWHVRPETEALYENLDNYFPKIDLDRPFVEGPVSIPTTPASESPRSMEATPPPRLPTPEQHQQQLPPKPISVRTALAGFNKAENRKSIRVMADHKRRTLLRIEDKKDKQPKEEDRPKRRFSMWGHKIQEVTPSKLVADQLENKTPEPQMADGNPATLTWVKGELIGKGSYGRVYIALNVTTGDMMAVKQVELPNTERDRHDRRQLGMIDALKSEIALLKDLYHPNIVAYLGCETSPEYLSIFLEYVPGGTIASIYRTPDQARFEEQLVKFFTKQILEGLAYLHGRHIWHRDLKGDNILVDAAGVCKISDFGISKQTSDAYDSFGQATTMKGSVFWMAPEVIHSATERTYSGKVDIWSLGCVVLEMWSGQRPWGDMEQVAAMFELFNKRARPPLPPDIQLSPTALDFMNEQCLAKDPAQRPTAMHLLQHPFITDVDRNWTFERSKIGKAVAKRVPKTMKAPSGTRDV